MLPTKLIRKKSTETSNADFETAWKARGSDLAVIDCPGDVGNRYAYERQYGVDSIVYEVIHIQL